MQKVAYKIKWLKNIKHWDKACIDIRTEVLWDEVLKTYHEMSFIFNVNDFYVNYVQVVGEIWTLIC